MQTISKSEVRYDLSLLSEDDLHLFNEGTHYCLFDKLGSHSTRIRDVEGTYFGVWAPNAEYVSVVADFNGWDRGSHPLRPRGSSGIWEGFLPPVPKGSAYKYHMASRFHGYKADKADPFALYSEQPPRTASRIWSLEYQWQDQDWMAKRQGRNSLAAPISIYEVHLGSWARMPEDGNRSLSYREIAPKLAEHVTRTGFTHVELLPIMEHPFYGSWGYQSTGYFAPTSRYGTPQDFMFLVDYLHRQGIGVILDWVPSHFPTDEHGLAYFDGTHLFEHADPREGFHPDWGSYIFNYGRNEVRAFLMSSAMFWLDMYHADGLRVDAVASMLYRDYSRKQGEWIPNKFGGRENLEAIDFLRRFNQDVYQTHPDVQTMAEESTAWPMVSRHTYIGGLGFGMKWDMGWMHDTLLYFEKDPIHRKYHQGTITFRMIYAFNENFVLPLSHDEVVHGKGSLLGKMPGDEWQRFANLRLLYAYQWSQPGKKLLFMGGDFGQVSEWRHDTSLEWHVLQHPNHAGIQRFLEDLNSRYRSEPALFERDFEGGGFEWIDANDAVNSTLAYLRHGNRPEDTVLAVLNFTPVPRYNYRVGVPVGGFWEEILNSDAPQYWGSGQGNLGGVEAAPVASHGRSQSLSLTLPPLGAVWLKPRK